VREAHVGAIKFDFGGITECEGWRRLGESNTVPVGELRFIRPLLVNRPVSLPPPEMLFGNGDPMHYNWAFCVENLWRIGINCGERRKSERKVNAQLKGQ